jgi:hypothetical protein
MLYEPLRRQRDVLRRNVEAESATAKALRRKANLTRARHWIEDDLSFCRPTLYVVFRWSQRHYCRMADPKLVGCRVSEASRIGPDV